MDHRDDERCTPGSEAHYWPPPTQVDIVEGRFAGRDGRLLGYGTELATVDLGVPIDGGSGVVVVPVSAVRERRIGDRV